MLYQVLLLYPNYVLNRYLCLPFCVLCICRFERRDFFLLLSPIMAKELPFRNHIFCVHQLKQGTVIFEGTKPTVILLCRKQCMFVLIFLFGTNLQPKTNRGVNGINKYLNCANV